MMDLEKKIIYVLASTWRLKGAQSFEIEKTNKNRLKKIQKNPNIQLFPLRNGSKSTIATQNEKKSTRYQCNIVQPLVPC